MIRNLTFGQTLIKYMEQLQSNTFLTLEEYQQLEEQTDQRYEYHDGEVFAMAGGEPKHNAISVNAIVALSQLLRNRDCNVFNSDQKVHIASITRSLYPDISVTCGPVERSEKDTKAIANPVLLIEVLSDSTIRYDQGNKFKFYSELPSLQEYVLISQHEPAVQIFYRKSFTDLWQITWVEGLDQSVSLQSLGIEVPLRELYLKTENL